MRVVFMGTPDIAKTCLRRICEDGIQVVGVYTKKDTPKNRGMKMLPSPVKEYALSRDIPVFQPDSFRDDGVVEQLRALRPDLIAVVAYGKILPQRVLDIPPIGAINIHASILPELRGSGPIQWAVLRGLPETGVTAMYMAAEMDAGDMIEVRKTPISPTETAGELMDRMADIGADLLRDTLRAAEKGNLPRTPQDHSMATFAPMLDKSLCPISWEKSPWEISCQVRGLNPWPIATMERNGKKYKVYTVAVTEERTDQAPGQTLGLTKTGLRIACGGGGVLEIRELQAEGGRRMPAPDYFRGHPQEI